MTVHGNVDVGYRFTDVTGSEAMYDRLFDLASGPRLMSVDLLGTAPKGADVFADMFGISVNGVGDPFAAVQGTMRKSRRYDVRVNWRRSRFVDTFPLTPASLGGLNTQAVTDAHAWTTSRQLGTAALVYDVSNRLHLLANYSHAGRTGPQLTTRSLDFIGSPSVWGAFARANPFSITTPIDDSANRVSGGISYSRNTWTVNYQAGYQIYNEHRNFRPVATPERSINVADPATGPELLNVLSASQSRRLTSPLSELSYVIQPWSKFEWRGEYLIYRYRGPFEMSAAYQGVARTNTGGTAFSPYDLMVSGSGSATAPNQVLGQAVTYRLTDQWTLEGDYRYSRFTMDARGDLAAVLGTYPTGTPGPLATSEHDEQSWKQTSQWVGVLLMFEPSPALTLRPGIRFLHRDIERRIDGVLDSGTSQKNHTVWPEIVAAYRPNAEFSARGSYSVANSDTSYTRLSPVDRSIGHLVIRYEPVERFAVEATADKTDAELPAAAFVSHTRLASLQASYKIDDRLTAVGGIDYQSFLGLGNVSFLRGEAPLAEDELRDRERDRIWSVGAVVDVTQRLDITASANFLRATGTDAIAGEPPLYGPLTFPYGTAAVSYSIPRAGKVTAEFSRSRFEQEILSLNDFRAMLFTIRFSRDF